MSIQASLRELRERRFVNEAEKLMHLESDLLSQRNQINDRLKVIRQQMRDLAQKREQD